MVPRRREEGIALMLAMLLLFVLATLALSSMDMAMQDSQMVGSKKSSEASLQMAEAGVADALDFLYNRYDPIDVPEVGTEIIVSQHGGFGGTFAKQGSFEQADGEYGLVGNIKMVGLGEPCMTADPAHHYGVWDIEVEGISGGGRSESAVHFAALMCQCTDIRGCY